MTEEMFWPEVIKAAPIPEGFTIKAATVRIKGNMASLKPAVHEIVMDCWYAHEILVKKLGAPGETWGGFCKDLGYHPGTPHRWFEKYGLTVTRIHGRLPDSANAESPKPPEEKEKSVAHFTVAEISREIESGALSDNAIHKISMAIGKAVDEGVANPRVAGPAAASYKKANVNKQRQQEFKEAMENGPLGPMTRVRRLFDRMTGINDELTILSEGKMSLEGGDEPWVIGIRNCGPSFCWAFHRLGVNLQGVIDTLISPKMDNKPTLPNPAKEVGNESKPEGREEADTS